MSVNDPQAWLNKSQEDEEVIALLMASEAPPYSMVCYHARQAAEKKLKALLISMGLTPPRTHDLVHLLTRCEESGAHLGDLFEDCEFLLRFAAASGYPGEEVNPDREQALECVRALKQISTPVEGHLPG